MRRLPAFRDDTLAATVVRRTPLAYCAGPDLGLDRPGHVRAGSSLAWIGERLAVIQDDANFLALIEPRAGRVEAIPLPPGEGGARQFDELRGTKHLKLDLEACVTVQTPAGELLAAFGSGSAPRRETIALVNVSPDWQVTLHHAAAFYRRLREQADFADSEVNVEGAVFLDGVLRLFNRGNGAPRNGLVPVDATVEVAWSDLWTSLLDPARGDPPPLGEVVQYDLGAVAGQRLTFTDAALAPWGLLYSAAAEDSPDAVRDGLVAGSALGIFEASQLRWTELRTPDGALFPGKVEGIAPMPQRDDRVYLIIDVDDPQSPSELCEAELTGPWRAASRPS